MKNRYFRIKFAVKVINLLWCQKNIANAFHHGPWLSPFKWMWVKLLSLKFSLLLDSLVQSLSGVQLFATHGLQHSRPPCPSPTPGVYPNSCPLSPWCHPTISSFVVPFFWLQSFPASGSFQMNQLFPSSGWSIGASASVSNRIGYL